MLINDLEMDDSEEAIYYKQVVTNVKSKTVFHEKPHYIIIDQIELQEGGFLTGKILSFTIQIPTINIKTV